MSNTIPLPEPDGLMHYVHPDGRRPSAWSEAQVHAHAAAVSAAKDAEIAALRAEYERACKLVADMHAAAMGAKVGPLLDVVGDVAAVVHKNTALQERIKVLEDALQRYVNYDLLTGTRGKMNEIARAALGDKT